MKQDETKAGSFGRLLLHTSIITKTFCCKTRFHIFDLMARHKID